MAFTKGWNFRGNSFTVTDGANETYVLADAYPTTRNGVTFGWVGSVITSDDDTSADRRLAGVNSPPGGSSGTIYFRIDLPSAGTYTFRAALGRMAGGSDAKWELRDGASTVLATWNTTGQAVAHFRDAGDNDRAAAAWPGSNAPITITTAGTDLRLYAEGDYTMVAHVDLTDGGGALTAGSASSSGHGDTTADLACAAATGGTAPYTYQWYRSTTNGVLGTAVSGATSLALHDTGLAASTTYYYTCRATDSAGSPATADSNQVTVTTSASQIHVIFAGDSITNGFGLTGVGTCTGQTYEAQSMLMLGTVDYNGFNAGHNGDTTAGLLARLSTDVYPYCNGSKNIVVILIGTNNITVDSASTIYANLRAIYAAIKAHDPTIYVVAVTIPPSNASAGSGLPVRNAVNASLKANWRTLGTVDGLADFGDDGVMGLDSSPGDTSLYQDGTHPTAAGAVILGSWVAPVVAEVASPGGTAAARGGITRVGFGGGFGS